jgi:hypothetical protein
LVAATETPLRAFKCRGTREKKNKGSMTIAREKKNNTQ